MILQIIKSNILIYIMAGLCIFGIILRVIITRVYGKLIKDSEHMGTTTNKMLKSLRIKFETNYSMNISVHNVDTFVDKYVYMNKLCGIFLYTWENLSGQTLLMCMLTGVIGSVLAVLYECGKQLILSTLVVGILTSAILIVVEYLLNLPVKKYVIQTNIKDFLENYLAGRLDSNKKRMIGAGRQGENLQNHVQAAMAATQNRESSDKGKAEQDKSYEIDKKDEQIINDIINEFIC